MSLVGNYRITNKIDKHNVVYMRADMKKDESSDPKTTTLVLSILLAISVIIAAILGFCACKLMKSEGNLTHEEEPIKEGGQGEHHALEMHSARAK